MKNKEQIAKIWDVLDSLNIDVLQNKKDISRIDEVLSVSNLWEPQKPKPKLKQLDQSVFNHPYVDDRFNYVALNADGQSIFFEQKPSVSVNLDIWVATGGSIMPMLKGYDATNWQNSLIERDIAAELLEVDLSSELTGSDLCRALKNRDEWVLAYVSDENDATAEFHQRPAIVTGATVDGRFKCGEITWRYAIPINNQGQPLTAAEAGL